jgi:AraC-like DNA-binding protein
VPNDPLIQTPRWTETPRWYLWDGGFLLTGRSDGVVPPHSHHAIQISIAVQGQVAVKGSRGGWREGSCLIVRQDAEHSYTAAGATGAMLFVDPESYEGAWLRSALVGEITVVPETRSAASREAIRILIERPFEMADVRELIRGCVHSLCPGAPPSRRADDRVTRVIAAIRKAEDLRMSIEDAADLAFLSPSRFAHVFKEQVGLTFRRYMLWRKLTRAMLAIGREPTLTAAAQASDFADAAHLTRTFYQMVGLAPSLLMRGEFFEIDSPFQPVE